MRKTGNIELFEIKHSPLEIPKKDSLSYLFMVEWLELCERATPYTNAEDEPLNLVLKNLPRLAEQRDATVAATIICDLGSSIGENLIHKAKQMRDLDLAAPYVLAWAHYNQPLDFLNHGWTLLEALMDENPTVDRNMRSRPVLNRDDEFVAICIMQWLSTKGGQSFLRSVKDKHKKTTKK